MSRKFKYAVQLRTRTGFKKRYYGMVSVVAGSKEEAISAAFQKLRLAQTQFKHTPDSCFIVESITEVAETFKK